MLFAPSVAEAQSSEQKVVVSTNRRLNVDGSISDSRPIVGAIVTIKEVANSVYTGTDGALTFGVPSNGSYNISSVFKRDYELADKFNVIGSSHYHSKEPLRIYMDDKRELENYRYAVAAKIRKSVQEEIAKLQSSLDSLESRNDANETELRQLRAEISRAWSEAETIVANVTEHYPLCSPIFIT